MGKKDKGIRFNFGLDFQKEILHYIIKDKQGVLCLKDIKDTYFTLISHSVIFKVIKKFSRKNGKVPMNRVVLLEEIDQHLKQKAYENLVTKEDFTEIRDILYYLFDQPLEDADIIREKIVKFAMYVEMKHLSESFDLTDFAQYDEYSREVAKILSKGEKRRDETYYLVKDVVSRQFLRKADPQILPTPIRQLNHLTNAGGLPKASIVVALDKSKATKTFTLVNIARLYLKTKKVVLYIDTENGPKEIMSRMEQSTLNRTKSDLISGEIDKIEQKHVRKYKRLGAEFIVRKIPANIGNANDIARIMDEIYFDTGLTVEVLIIDYMGKMGSIQGHDDDYNRIANVYIDIENLAHERNLDVVWTAHHVKAGAQERRQTRYREEDIAKCIDIARNANMVFGLNSTEEEREQGIQRWEMVVQRDGPSLGRAVFKIDLPKQRLTELTSAQRKAYDEEVAPTIDDRIKDDDTGDKQKSRKPKREGDPEKANKVKDI